MKFCCLRNIQESWTSTLFIPLSFFVSMLSISGSYPLINNVIMYIYLTILVWWFAIYTPHGVTNILQIFLRCFFMFKTIWHINRGQTPNYSQNLRGSSSDGFVYCICLVSTYTNVEDILYTSLIQQIRI